MKIVCPACEAAYEVPDAVARPRRSVRCARCGEVWTPLAESAPAATSWAAFRGEPALEPDVGPAPMTAQLPVRAASWPVQERPAVIAAAWVLSLVILIGGLWLAVAGRQQVMQAWPPSTRLYAALGLEPSLGGGVGATR